MLLVFRVYVVISTSATRDFATMTRINNVRLVNRNAGLEHEFFKFLRKSDGSINIYENSDVEIVSSGVLGKIDGGIINRDDYKDYYDALSAFQQKFAEGNSLIDEQLRKIGR